MGQQSLEKISIEKYLIQWKEGFLEEMDKQYLFDHFLLGEGANKDKLAFYRLYIKTFSMKNCELSEWVWKKINGTLENTKKLGIDKIKPFKDCSVQKVIEVCDSCDWQAIFW